MHNQEKITFLQDLVKINSVSGHEQGVANYLENFLNQHGIIATQVHYSEGRTQLVAYLNDAKENILGFSGHMDVVPIGEMQWDHPPFSGEIVENKLYGRGATDMKSGLAAAIIAMIELKEANVPLSGNVKLLATVGEETSAIGAKQLTALGYADDLSGLIIGEPTNLNVGIAHKGALWPLIKTYGKTAHGSLPQFGVNAIDHMLLFIEAFKKKFTFSQFENDLLGAPTYSIDVIQGGTATNEIPDVCSLQIDIRTIPELKHDYLKQGIQEIIDSLTKTVPHFKADVQYINDMLGINTNPTDSLVKISLDIVNHHVQEPRKTFGGPGYTDGSAFVKAKTDFPIVIIGPGNPEYAHQPNECVELDTYLTCIDIYKEIIQKICT